MSSTAITLLVIALLLVPVAGVFAAVDAALQGLSRARVDALRRDGVRGAPALLQVVEDRWDDGARCAGLVLDPALVQVLGRPVKAFQGWRYLLPEDAPADVAAGAVEDGELPAALRAQLRALCLL